MPRERRPEEESHGAPGWFVTYADMMGLLLTFFILLVSFSTLEEKRVREAVSSLRGALGVLPQSTHPQGRPVPGPTGASQPTRAEQTQARLSRLQKQLRAQGLERQIQVAFDEKGILNIRIPSSVLFRSGSAEILPSASPALRDIADILGFHLETYDSDIRVEGHSDDVPISTSLARTFPTNWELSSARALAIMRFFTVQTALPEDHFGVAGYAQYKPLRYPVTLEENRRYNRRVEIIAVPKKNVEKPTEDKPVGPQARPMRPIPRDDLPEPL